jgi:chemotaxis protein MotB
LREGQNRKGDIESQKRSYNLQAAEAALAKADADRLKALKGKIEAAIESNSTLKMYKKQLLLDITTEGLRIQMVDEQNRPMFALAKAELQPYTKEILHEIGKALNEVPNKISLSGHTDSAPYGLGEKGYSNWELSADRANASRRELIFGGMDESKVLRVVGLSSSVLFDKQDPLNPINRRISIIVMNKKAEESASQDGGAVEVVNQADSSAEVSVKSAK